MRDQFVGDVNDYGKYGLVRYLCGITANDDQPNLTLGVIWYFQCGEADQGGNNTAYLFSEKQRAKYRECDPPLWEAMRGLVCGDQRKVSCVEALGILPADKRYFSETPTYSGTRNNNSRAEKSKRCAEAKRWLDGAVSHIKGANIVLLDPDNKISPEGASIIGANSPRFAHMNEIKAFWNEGHSLVIYHQTGGKAPLEGVHETSKRLRRELEVEPIRLRFRPANRTLIFFVIAQPEHRKIVCARVKQMRNGPWNEHFKRV